MKTPAIAFKESDFILFTNVVDESKRHWYAEKEYGKYAIQVNGGMFKAHFSIEIVKKTTFENTVKITQLAKGSYKTLDALNQDLTVFLSKNMLCQ